MKNEVFIFKIGNISKIVESRSFFPLILMLTMIVMLSISIFLRKKSPEIDLKTENIERKIDYLIEITNYYRNSNIDIFPIYLILIPIMIYLFTYFYNFIYRPNTFYFGKEIYKYDSMKSLREKLFWGVIVAAIVGFAVSFLGGYAPINHPPVS